MTRKGNGLRHGSIAVELLLLGTVTGLAIGVCTWKWGERVRASRVRSAKAQMAEFYRALWFYYSDVGAFPPDTGGLAGLLQDPGTVGWRGPYLDARRLPQDPWGGEYRYLQIGRFDPLYEIVTAGPDRKFDSADDIGVTFRAPEKTRTWPEKVLTDSFGELSVCI